MNKVVYNDEKKIKIYQTKSDKVFRDHVRLLERNHKLIPINNGDYMVKKKWKSLTLL